MTTAEVKRRLYAAGCGGEDCDSEDTWPLHHVRHRGIFLRLCTSCVLKHHLGCFCALCFELLDGPPTSVRSTTVVRCSTCLSVSHSSCLADRDQEEKYICACCASPDGFSYFPKKMADGRWRLIDLSSAKVLLAAARLAATSMSRAAVSARVESERKVKEAMLARKRARDLLERAFLISSREKESNDVVEMKRKMPKPSSTVASKGASVTRIPNHVTFDAKDIVRSFSHPPNHVENEEKEKKYVFLGRENGSVKVEERGIKMNSDRGPRIPQANPDLSVSRTNSRALIAVSPNTASLHS